MITIQELLDYGHRAGVTDKLLIDNLTPDKVSSFYNFCCVFLMDKYGVDVNATKLSDCQDIDLPIERIYAARFLLGNSQLAIQVMAFSTARYIRAHTKPAKFEPRENAYNEFILLAETFLRSL